MKNPANELIHPKKWIHIPHSESSEIAMVKYHFFDSSDLDDTVNDGFVVFFCDLRRIYMSHMTLTDIKIKNEELNSSLTYASHRSLLTNIEKCLLIFCHYEKGDGTKLSTRQNDDTFQLEVSIRLGGRIPFRWVFEATGTSADFFRSEMTIPMLKQKLELVVETRRLRALLKAKDAEIEDLKLSGAKVSRKALITNKFEHKEDEAESKMEEWLTEFIKANLEEDEEKSVSLKERENVYANDDSDPKDGSPDGKKRSFSATEVSNATSSSSSTPSASASVSTSALLPPPSLGVREKAAKVRKKKLGL